MEKVTFGSGDIEIGYVENYKGDMVIMWFYRKENERWIKCHEERCHKKHREYHLRRVIRKARITILNRGT